MKYLLILLIFVISITSCDKTKTNPPKVDIKEHFRPDDNKIVSRIAFSSGCKQDRFQGFWNDISSKNPDLWIWGGDNIYSDTETRNLLNTNYNKLKNNTFYQDFIKKTPVIGVWYDHDYGSRDGGKDYAIKKESKEEFIKFFDLENNNDINSHDGIYDVFELGSGNKTIKIYLLDNRYFKTELQADNETGNWYIEDSTGTVLGESQWNWLETEINSSNALINIFVSGIQIIPNDHIYEKWGNFPKERTRFINLMEKTKVKNPIILSGDRHFAEFSKINFSDGSSLLEFTASGMTHSFEDIDEPNVFRVGDLFGGKNFGMIEIDWQEDKANIDLIIYDIKGVEILKNSFIAKY